MGGRVQEAAELRERCDDARLVQIEDSSKEYRPSQRYEPTDSSDDEVEALKTTSGLSSPSSDNVDPGQRILRLPVYPPSQKATGLCKATGKTRTGLFR